jgi:hypothetical protein
MNKPHSSLGVNMIYDESSELKKRFATLLNKVRKNIEFDPEWADTVGYPHAVSLVKLAVGEVAQSLDKRTNRGLVLVGTSLGTVVVYEANPSDSKEKFALKYNVPKQIEFMLGGSNLNVGRFSLIVTDFDPTENIGTHLAGLNAAMNAVETGGVPATPESEYRATQTTVCLSSARPK